MPAYNIPLAAVFGIVQVLLVFMLGLHLEDRCLSLGVGDLLRAMWESPTAFLLEGASSLPVFIGLVWLLGGICGTLGMAIDRALQQPASPA